MDRSAARRAVPAVPYVVAAALSVLVAGRVVTQSFRGLDLMDEGYQLRLIANPEQSTDAGEVYFYAFLVHPLFEAVGRDVGSLRLVGMLVLAACAGAAGIAVSRVAGRSGPGAWVSALVAAGAVSPLLTLGVRVPAYRAVALLGLLVVAWGATRIVRDMPVTGGCLVGLGGWLVFAGKPTSGAVALLLVLLCGRPLGFFRVRVLTAAAGGLLSGGIVTLALAQLTPLGAFDYLRGGLKVARLLGGHPSALGMMGWPPRFPLALLVFGAPVLLVAVIGLWGVDRAATSPRSGYWVLATTAATVLTSWVVALRAAQVLREAGDPHLVLQVALVVPALALVIWWRTRRPGEVADRRVTALFVLLLCSPYALAVGSNVSIALTMSQGVVLWVLSGILIASRPSGGQDAIDVARLGVFLTTSACVVAIVVSVAFRQPFDGTTKAPELVRTPVLGGTLSMAQAEADRARLLRLVGEGRVTDQTPVLDLSGIGPGYAVMLGGRFIGRAHLYSTWAGGTDSARHVLDQVPCSELASAWVIHAADSPGVVAALTARGVDLDRDYDEVLAFEVLRYGRTWDMRVLAPTPRLEQSLGC